MDLFLTILVALKALARNKLRAGLTVLGVVIGIAAVTTMVSIGSSAGQLLQSELQGFGTNFMYVEPGSMKRGGVREGRVTTLTDTDAVAIAEECNSVLAASPLIFASGRVVRQETNWQPNEMWGVGVDYLLVRNWPLEAGGMFMEDDIQSASQVCVIGHTLVRKLFLTENPIGQTIRIANIPFRVIGVLKEKGADMVGQDQDNILLIPYTTAKKRLIGSSFNDVHAIIVSAKASELVEVAGNEIRSLLMDRHRIAFGMPADFEVHSSNEIAELMGNITGIMTALLAAIAGISLLVGGVGIMNIMLVSVTERTREIGIRMAVGARGRDILIQFLVESVILSCIGGAVGLALGIGASAGITALINEINPGKDWPIVISFTGGIVAIGFAAAVGIIFGMYPAWRASRLDPIDALRYE